MCTDCNYQSDKALSKWEIYRKKFIFEVKQFFPRLIERMHHRILRLAIDYIKYNAVKNKSNLVLHARKEFEIAFNTVWKPENGDPDIGDSMQHFMCEQIIELLSLLHTQGDSGGSIGYKLGLFKKCVEFDILSPLTLSDEEFGIVGSFDNSKQNRRKSSVFKYPDGSIIYIDGFSKLTYHYIGDKGELIHKKNSYTVHGGVFVVRPDKSIYRISGNVKLKPGNSFNFKTFILPVYEIEYPHDWWLSLVKESELDPIKEVYDVVECDNNFEDELNWKEGKYRDEIVTRVNAIIDHMYPNNN